jgi:cell division protein FtsL
MSEITTPEIERKTRRYERVRTGLLVIILVVVLVSAGILIFNQYHNRDTLDYMKDCTTPTGECYKQLQEQSAQSKVVKDLKHDHRVIKAKLNQLEREIHNG